MNKRIWIFPVILVLCLTAVIAQSESGLVSVETQAETKIMNSSYGAQVRVLQLQKAINRMILHAEALNSFIEENSEDVTELENIVEEMKILLDESKLINIGSSKEEIIRNFVDVKEDAIILREEYKETASVYLNHSDKEEAIEKLKEIDRTGLQEYNNQIKAEIRAFNSERILNIIRLTGIKLSGLADKVESGEIQSAEALKKIKAEYKLMDTKEKNQIRVRFSENVRQRDSAQAAVISDVSKKRVERVSQRAEQRAQALAEKGYPILANRVQVRSDIFSVRVENRENIRNIIKENLRIRSSAAGVSLAESANVIAPIIFMEEQGW